MATARSRRCSPRWRRPPSVDFELESYEVHSMGVGRDARGEANLSARIGGEHH
jgi:hypothetical protein